MLLVPDTMGTSATTSAHALTVHGRRTTLAQWYRLRAINRPISKKSAIQVVRNDGVNVLRELLKMICELHEPGRLEPSATQIEFL